MCVGSDDSECRLSNRSWCPGACSGKAAAAEQFPCAAWPRPGQGPAAAGGLCAGRRTQLGRRACSCSRAQGVGPQPGVQGTCSQAQGASGHASCGGKGGGWRGRRGTRRSVPCSQRGAQPCCGRAQEERSREGNWRSLSGQGLPTPAPGEARGQQVLWQDGRRSRL